jgi:hypothetical protein
VISRIEPGPEANRDPASELDSRATACRGRRTRTLDPRIAFLHKP